ncbi:MAG: lysophospholipid acyltransferase family protein [Bacillota bacterium]
MLYSVLKKLFYFIFEYLCRWQVTGIGRIPETGPIIIISNHVSYWDPIVLGVISKRQVYFMAKAELFRIPVFSSILRGLGAFPVDRKKSDRAALRAAAEVLERGDVLGMFPEGTRIRTGELGEFKLGAVLIAAKSKTPIVPVALQGTSKIFSRGWFRPFKVAVGNPYYWDDMEERKLTSKELQEITNNIKEQILIELAGI